MATFYEGPRPVLKGRNSNEMVNPYFTMTGKAKGVGTYSHYPYYSTSHVLDGAPDRNHVPGTGYFPGDVFMSQLFTGSSFYVHPLSGVFPDGSATYDGARFRPMEYKGISGAKAFPSSFGHEERENDYKVRQYRFKGVTAAQVMTSVGHGPRTEAQGAPNSFGVFRPDEPHYVPSGEVFTDGYGYGVPTTYDNAYGRNRVQEWRGVPSSKAL
jgi:hypothetical protein